GALTMRRFASLMIGVALLPAGAWAQDDSFDLSAAPAPKEPPKLLPNAIAIGLGYQTHDSFYFGRYGGVTGNGLFLTHELSVRCRDPWDSGKPFHWDINAGLTAPYSGYVATRFGEQGKWRASASFDSFTRWFTESSRTPFDGAGTNRLTLPAGW